MKNNSSTRKGYRVDIILPHWNSCIRFHVKRYANGHVAYDMEKNGKMAYGHFIQTTREEINKLIANSAKLAEAQIKGLGLVETLEEVYG